ncbi:MAG: DEAD/DEAH box helicase, partial [Clostridiales bacterium]|nr:DEAD/DEAH box helicase [Clostridiales bacterium]
MNQNSAISEIKGIGAKTEELFHKIGVYTVGDILLHYPRTYIQYPKTKHVDEVIEGETAAVVGRIVKTPVVRKVRTMQLVVTTIGEMNVSMELVWFRMPYMKNNLKVGCTYIFYGKVNRKNGRFVMEQSTVYSTEQYAAMEQVFLPVYGLTGGLSNNLVTKTVRAALQDDNLFRDYLPSYIREKLELCEYNYAIRQIHFPTDMDTLITARKRLVFDEFFLFILSMQYQKEKREKEPNGFAFAEDGFVERLIEKLPYELTKAQRRALGDVMRDMRSETVMQRLIQGDVGSGKTIIAFLAMADAAHNGYQSAIMAPTEVLARQHYESYQKLCEDFGLHIPVVLLTGSMTAKQKRRAYEALEVYP